MGLKVWLYHKDNAPDGQIFDTDEHSIDILQQEEGWVDDPVKFGHDPTGQTHPETLARMRQEFEDGGGTRGAGEPTYEELRRKWEAEHLQLEEAQKEAEAKQAEIDRLNALLKTPVSAEEQRRRDAERDADEIADRERGQTKGKDAEPKKDPAPKAPATRRRKAAAKSAE